MTTRGLLSGVLVAAAAVAAAGSGSQRSGVSGGGQPEPSAAAIQACCVRHKNAAGEDHGQCGNTSVVLFVDDVLVAAGGPVRSDASAVFQAEWCT